MDSDIFKDYIEKNKHHWNVSATKNWNVTKAEFPKMLKDIASYLAKRESHIYPYLKDIEGKRIIVLQSARAFLTYVLSKLVN